MLKIWGRKNSVNVEKVLWCALELDLLCERIDAGGTFGVVDTPAFRALNPRGLVPVIEDGDVVLWESNTIIRYLAARYGADRLIPTDPAARAQVERWMDLQLGAIAPAFSPMFLGLVRTAPAARDMELITRSFGTVAANLTVVDAGLVDGRPFLTGPAFTVADIALGSVAHRWFNLPLDGTGLTRPALPHLAAWYERLKARPAAAQLFSPLT
ncbi:MULTISPECIES: glutathione S-transferase family protein [unclassified Xanthobacter]|uniref:glutathione S-transferase family protein n=1 Tax=unclassified Xanthobacter TaxID=2623496 RepID=UPI001EDE31FA|nr:MULTISPECIES: glutathione S-transferase [unclassified Xanthobacter]